MRWRRTIRIQPAAGYLPRAPWRWHTTNVTEGLSRSVLLNTWILLHWRSHCDSTANSTRCYFKQYRSNNAFDSLEPLCFNLGNLQAQYLSYAMDTLDKQSCVFSPTLFEMSCTCMRLCELNFSCLLTSINSAEVSSCQNKRRYPNPIWRPCLHSCLRTFILRIYHNFARRKKTLKM